MTTHVLTQERIALNQSTFRDANKRIEQAASGMNLDGLVPFVCECPDPGCVTIVQLTLDTYRDLRRNSRRFFGAPGHQVISLDAGAAVLVAEFPDYVVLDKVGRAGEIAEEKDRKETPHG